MYSSEMAAVDVRNSIVPSETFVYEGVIRRQQLHYAARFAQVALKEKLEARSRSLPVYAFPGATPAGSCSVRNRNSAPASMLLNANSMPVSKSCSSRPFL